MFRRFRIPTFLLLALTVYAYALQGQDFSKGTIAGTVRDGSGAVMANASVTLQWPAGNRSAMTGPEGKYFFSGLPVGSDYLISVTKEGFQPENIRGVVVHANRETAVDVTLGSRETTQMVKTGFAQHEIEPGAASITTVISESLYQKVPVERNVSAVIAMAPGVSGSSISGATALENRYLVNGADATDPIYGAFGPARAGAGMNFDFIKEAQVVPAAAEARYGQALGGTVNLVTKSGGNAFHGSLFSYFQPREFEAARPDPNRLTTSQHTRLVNEGRYDFGGDLGGYLIRNKLFFYGGFNPQYGRSYRIAASPFANAKLGEVPVKSRTLAYTAKLNWSLTPTHQFEASIFGDPSFMPMGFIRPYSLAADNDAMASRLEYGSRVWTGRYTGQWTPNWLVNASFSHYFNEFRETPKYEGYSIIDNTGVQRGAGGQFIRGGLGLLENTESRVNQITWSGAWRKGSHSLSFGYQFEDRDYDRLLRYTGAPFALPDRPELGFAAGRTMYGAQLVRRYLNPTDPASPTVLELWGGYYSKPSMTGWTRYQAAYLEDSWNVGKRLTIRPGIRWEKQRISGVNSVNPSFGDN